MCIALPILLSVRTKLTMAKKPEVEEREEQPTDHPADGECCPYR